MEQSLSGSAHFEKQGFNEGFFKTAFENLEEEEFPYAMILFERDGSVSSLRAPEELIGAEDVESVSVALDFAHYAFSRADWMVEYITHADAAADKLEASKKEEDRPKLVLIRGGLEENDSEI